jgi:hypothetical protein
MSCWNCSVTHVMLQFGWLRSSLAEARPKSGESEQQLEAPARRGRVGRRPNCRIPACCVLDTADERFQPEVTRIQSRPLAGGELPGTTRTS